jgi:hypothetical protein
MRCGVEVTESSTNKQHSLSLAEAALQAIKERRERTGKGRPATQSEKKAFAAGAVVNKGPAAARAAAGDDEYPKSLPASSPYAIAFSAAAVLDQRRVRHGTVDTARIWTHQLCQNLDTSASCGGRRKMAGG